MCYYLQLVSLLYILIVPPVCSYNIHSPCPQEAHTLTRWTSMQLIVLCDACCLKKIRKRGKEERGWRGHLTVSGGDKEEYQKEQNRELSRR